MLVVSDASVINVLVRVDQIGILVKLFGTIVVPPAVAMELSATRTPEPVRRFVASPPPWLQTRPPRIPLENAWLGRGEREAIALACELGADLLLVDDREARTEAQRLGVVIMGAIGILELAAVKGYLDLNSVFRDLRTRAPDFRAKQSLLDAALERDGARRPRETSESLRHDPPERDVAPGG